MLGLIGGDKTYENDGVQRQRKNPEKAVGRESAYRGNRSYG